MKKSYSRNTLLFDCGAGQGHVAEALCSDFPNMLALDPFSELSAIRACAYLAQDCTSFPFPSGAVGLFCRPCHSDWVDITARRILANRGQCLYIGLPHNLEKDLDPDSYQIVPVPELTDCGEEHECGWKLVSHNTSSMTEFLRIHVTGLCLDYISWFELKGGNIYNFNGGRQPFNPKEHNVLEKVQAEDFQQLDWKKTSMYDLNPKRDRRHGWMAPNGDFYGCESQCHDTVADMLFKSTCTNLQNQGWLKIQSGDPCVYSAFASEQNPNQSIARPTEKQLQVCLERGFETKGILRVLGKI